MNIENPQDNPTQEERDGVTTETNQEVDNAQPIEGGDPNLNGGGEDPEAGKAGGENEVPSPGTEEVAEPEPRIEERLQKFEETLLQKFDERLKPITEQPRQITEEQWVEHEKTWGLPRTAIAKTTEQSVKVYNKMKEYVDAELGVFKKDLAINSLARDPKFADINSLRSGIDEFLKDFAPRDHSNPQLLQRGYYYSKGLKSSANVTRARVSDEKNRQIAGRIKTGKPDVNVRNKSTKPLTEAERQVAEMLPGGEKEFRDLKNPARRIIAA